MKKIFQGKRILIMGLGLNGGGVGAAEFFYKQKAEVLVTDLKSEKQLKESLQKLKKLKIKYSLSGHKESDFLWADLIIKNPDVPETSPYLEIARKNKITVETDVSLFFKLSQAFIIGVTGTKGKSTTSSLIFHILKQKYKRIFLAGNIGVSPLELLPKIKKGDKVVLELSSFELEGLKQSPNISVITNIYPDHLNRYGNMEDYIKAKKIIFQYQKKNNALFLNAEDPTAREFAKESRSTKYFFSPKTSLNGINISKFKSFGNHNLFNLSAAIEVAKIMKIPTKLIEKSLAKFKGVANRQEFIREINGVKYFNDTTATMPEAAITAIKSFSENFPNSKIILICGGQNKGLKYVGVAKAIEEKVGELVMLPGTASEEIKKYLSDYKNLHEVSSIIEAVKKAESLAKRGDVVILSPSAASFNLFKNEFDRGRQFVQAVKNL
jgi:UDP-N-acetylmuramoylalanine--D-glutamate ligase